MYLIKCPCSNLMIISSSFIKVIAKSGRMSFYWFKYVFAFIFVVHDFVYFARDCDKCVTTTLSNGATSCERLIFSQIIFSKLWHTLTTTNRKTYTENEIDIIFHLTLNDVTTVTSSRIILFPSRQWNRIRCFIYREIAASLCLTPTHY